MSPPSSRQAKRTVLTLVILSAALAICAIAFHRQHNRAVEQAQEVLADAVAVRAIKSAHWLNSQEATFRDFAAQVTPIKALDPSSALELTAQLRAMAPAFTDLAVINDTGRTVWGGATTGSLHESFPWFRDAAGPARFSGGIYPAPDAAPRVLFSRRLTKEGRGWHLRGEADAAALATFMGKTEDAGWVLAPEQGAVMPLAGLVPGPALRLRLGEFCRGPLPAALRLDNGWLVAAAGIPERKTALAVFTPEPSAQNKNIGLGLTILAAVCLAYAGFIRARALKG
ncbi:MAG: hypothetical protein KKE73_04325 [Proteobacteria bacterium]|nr:hypothetical protein [Pseudomonadota bacterium]